jgi:hypothetical protein
MEPMYQSPKPGPAKSPGLKAGGRRANRRRRTEPGDQLARYFVGRPADDDGKPSLEQEVASEPEGLVIAFKNDSRVYFVHEYRVTQRIEGNEVRLEKEPVSSAKRVSTANAS